MACAALLCGCGGMQSALDPRGPEAQSVAAVGWAMFAGAAAILLLVMGLALYAVYGAPERRRRVRSRTFIVAGGVVFPVVTLSALLAYGVVSMRALRAAAPAHAATIEVIGHRWWWEVRYHDTGGGMTIGANEIRIPAGQPVNLLLRSRDVIHSFWVPQLAGKLDLVPGRSNRLVLQADQPGVFRGQCAEYCGAQHARMAFHVVAEAPPAHAAWLVRQRQPAAVPAAPQLLRGRDAFRSHCAACHTVRGSTLARQPGPDLTHVAGRDFLAAGTLPNTRDNLLRYIAHSQEIKPGSGMPSHAHLGEEALHDIVAYLESLR